MTTRNARFVTLTILAGALTLVFALPSTAQQAHAGQSHHAYTEERATTLLRILSYVDDSHSGERFLKFLGIDTEDADELVTLAKHWDKTFDGKVLQSKNLEEQDLFNRRKHRSAGEIYGQWMRSLRAQGKNADSILKTILLSETFSVNTISDGSTEDQRERRRGAFREGIGSVLGSVPAFIDSVEQE